MTGNKVLTVLLFFILIPVLPALSQDVDILNYPAGSYNHEIVIKINHNLSSTGEIYYSFNPEDGLPDLQYKGGFLLSALKGEERLYNLKVSASGRVYNYSYLIDRKPPSLPEAILITRDDGARGYSFKEQADNNKIYYGYDDYNKGTVYLWNGELLSIPKSGFIYYYAEDEAGNTSDSKLLYQEVRQSRAGNSRLDIKSPVPGDFANPQLIYIDEAGFDWIKYTLNGLDPETNGADYNGPVEIRRYGNVNLRIAAKPAGSENIINEEINYRVTTRAPLKNIPASGVYSTGINIKSNFEDYRYCLEERMPLENDHIFDDKLSINPIYGSVKYISFRIKDFNNEPDSEFRYFYVIDDRYPASPVIDIDGQLPANSDVTVQMAGPAYSEIYYTTDGSTPSAASNVYNKPFVLRVPLDRNAGSYIIKARAVLLNEKSSDVVTRLITYDTKAPLKPEVRIELDSDKGTYNLRYEIEEGEKLFYCNGGEPSYFTEIDSDSFSLDVPDGMQKEFNFSFVVEDAAGNRSELSDNVLISLDRRPPSAARVKLFENEIVMESDERVEYSYRLYQNGILLETGKGVYSEPLKLFENAGSGMCVKLNVKTVDSSGNGNLSTHTFYPPAGVKAEGETFIFNSSSLNIYSGKSVTFHAYPDDIGDNLFYYLTKTLEDGEKHTEGPFSTDGEIIINGSDGFAEEYLLEVFSADENNSKKSRVSSHNFIIDNENPTIPEISGINMDTVFSGKITIAPIKDDDSRVFLVYSNSKENLPNVFSSSAIIFNKEIIFDVEDGKRKEFFLSVGAEDSAGNRTLNDFIYHFTIDKEKPVLNLNVAQSEASSDGSISITSATDESLVYYYEKGAKGSLVPEPDWNSQFFTKELLINALGGKDESVVLKIASYDEAGNRCVYPEVLHLNIDKKPPESPEVPDLLLFKDYRKIFVLSNTKSDGRLFYSVSASLGAEDAEFFEYVSPFSIKYSGDDEMMVLSFFVIDDAGNLSDTIEHIVRIPNVENIELVEGVKNNTSYDRDLHLTKLPDKKVVRYEILTDVIIPPEVTVFSPILPEKLEFKTEEGESIDFLVSLKEFQDNKDQTGGAEQVIRFTIDRQPPSPPEIDGITDAEYYLSDQRARFKGAEGVIYYKITPVGEDRAEYSKYTEAFDIVSAKGKFQSFQINAYTQDYAGNRSSEAEWTITIDKEIIYVSPDGQDYSEGTRSRPYKTINKAVEQVKNSDRKTIFIASGEYFINSSVIIDENVKIYGGFNGKNWFGKAGETIINVGDSFPAGNPVFYVYGGDLNINEVRLESGEIDFDTIFFINKGNLNINSCSISANCSNGSSLVRQNYGNLHINNTEISGKASSAPFISTDYGLVTINNSTLEADAGSDNLILIQAENSINFSMTGSLVRPGTGKMITAVKLINSNVSLNNNEIWSGLGNVSANIIEIINSKLKMNYCRVGGNSNNRITGGIISEDSQLKLKSNNFNFTGKNGIIGFSITGGESLISNNKISAESCSDFSYMFMLSGGKHSIETNITEVASAPETIFLRSRNADIDYLQNTLAVSGGKERLIIFNPEENSTARIMNNIIINRPEPGKGLNSVIFSTGTNMLSFKNNCLSGWDHLMTGSQNADTLITLDLLDGIYSAGQYSDNIEEQFSESFTAEDGYHLSSDSGCIDSGWDLSAIISESKDFDGEKRPNPLFRNPAFDIGADEYYE
ncbi:MAG: chitobiase/beta-hexosaminidase C-terminal domain-containing protein [Spirochaetales bacterium]|nr:chitobiase/beta-hexosaminidase C-terminal domain-containing protein [Spirochaetales bacterium]